MTERVDVILLAGDRGAADPLLTATGVSGKALVPAAGSPLLSRVGRALARWPNLGRLIVVAPQHNDYRSALADADLESSTTVTWVAPESSVSASVRAGLAAAQSPTRLLLTADHALLDPAWLDEMLTAAADHPRAAVMVGVVDWASVMERFPGSRRTRYRFSDGSICGTNLFVLRSPEAERLLLIWQGVEQQRKRPWRIVSLLGLGNLSRYMLGQLTLASAFRALSRRLNIEIMPVRISDPLSAVDVDSVEDLRLVESVLAEQGDGPC